MHRQIYNAVAGAIRNGAAADGVRLPSTRTMAQLLGVSRNTVLRAYDDLAADGLIEGEQGSGMKVRARNVADLSFANLRRLVAESGYPSRVLAIEDPDGNPLGIRH